MGEGRNDSHISASWLLASGLHGLRQTLYLPGPFLFCKCRWGAQPPAID